MGLVFNNETAGIYEAWCQSSQGRAMDRSTEELIMALVEPKPGERVLDIGCGTGNHLLAFSRLGLDISGIDASSYMIERARERLGHRCDLKKGMAEDLPFDDNEFDLAVLINTLEFLDDPLQALREAGRVANRKVFIGVMNSLSCNGVLKRLQGYLGDSLFSRAKFFNLWKLKALLQMAYGPVPVSWGCIMLSSFLAEEMMPFGNHLWNWKHYPFGSFLGISATMIYRIKTDNLWIRLKEARPSLFGAKTLEDLKHSRGVDGDKRGVSL